MDKPKLFEATDNEGLKQCERHLLRQPALVQFEVRADDDNGTSGVVNALAEKILAEAPLLAFEHVGNAFEGTVARAGDGAAVAAIVEQSVDSFLQHALFVVDDDVGRLHLHERK